MFNFRKERLVKDSIGQGSFGEVFPYQKNSEDFKWVVKRTKAKKIEDLLRCLPEIVLGFSCDHPCIVPVKGYSIESKDNKYNVFMKLPRMSGGNLADELKKRSKREHYFSENELVKHFYALVSAVDYLHNKKISHGDIKINNILLDDKGNLKLCDIGSGKYVPDEDHYNTMTAANGAINYKAPEIIQHERALKNHKLNGKNEKKDLPVENILKRENLYLADSWSLGLTMLEICMLEPRLINPYDSVQLIEENLQRIRRDVDTRYSSVLLDIIFSLLKTDPDQRLKVSVVKAKLEESRKQILTEDFKASLDLQKQNKQEAQEMSNYVKIFNEKVDEIIKAFYDEKKSKEKRLDLFEETLEKLQKKLDGFNLQIEKIKAERNKKLEEISNKYEADIQILKQENRTLIEKLGKLDVSNLEIEKINNERNKKVEEISKEQEKPIQILRQENQTLVERLAKESDTKLQIEKQQVVPKKPRDEEAYRKKLEKVSAGLRKKKWSEEFEIRSQGQAHLTIQLKNWKTEYFNNNTLKSITEDINSVCHKEDFWEEIDGLEMIFAELGSFLNDKITDEGLKTLACQLGPRLSNLNRLILNMNNWRNITDDALKEFANLVLSQMTNLKHLGLNMSGWIKIQDQGLEVFISQLAPKLKNVEHLDFNLGSWNKISGRGLALLGSQLGLNLTNVKHFKLSIGCWEITDEDFEIFASQLLPHLENLHAFEFGFPSIRYISDDSLITLASHFGSSLANINTLNLDFSGLPKITSQGLGSLANQITQNLTNLKDLTLNLSYCDSLRTPCVKNLRNQLKNISKVTIAENGIYPYCRS